MATIKDLVEEIDSSDTLKKILRIFFPFFYSDPESVRFRRKLLAGLRMLRGEYEHALTILEKDHILDRSVNTDAVIIDPGFVNLQGHHHNTNVFYKRILKDCGIQAEVLRSVREDESLKVDETESKKIFALAPYEMGFHPYLSYEQQIAYLNRLFYHEFCRVLNDSELQVMIAHTVRHTFVEGFSRFIKEYCSKQRCSLVLGIMEMNIISAGHPHHTVLRDVYRRSFNILSSISNLEVLTLVETQEVADFVTQTSDGKIKAQVQPHITAHLAEVKHENISKDESFLKLGFMGQTRSEKGVKFLPDIIQTTIQQSERPIQWVLQMDLNKLKEILDGEYDEAKKRMISSGSVQVFPTDLPLHKYYELMKQIDIMVMPYTGRYKYTGSGVSNESLNFGHVQVLPKDSSMFRNAESYGAGYITFDEVNVNSVSRAVLEAIDNFEALQKKSQKMVKTLEKKSNETDIVKNFILKTFNSHE